MERNQSSLTCCLDFQVQISYWPADMAPLGAFPLMTIVYPDILSRPRYLQYPQMAAEKARMTTDRMPQTADQPVNVSVVWPATLRVKVPSCNIHHTVKLPLSHRQTSNFCLLHDLHLTPSQRVSMHGLRTCWDKLQDLCQLLKTPGPLKLKRNMADFIPSPKLCSWIFPLDGTKPRFCFQCSQSKD